MEELLGLLVDRRVHRGVVGQLVYQAAHTGHELLSPGVLLQGGPSRVVIDGHDTRNETAMVGTLYFGDDEV